jgi:hypothetical protein
MLNELTAIPKASEGELVNSRIDAWHCPVTLKSPAGRVSDVLTGPLPVSWL